MTLAYATTIHKAQGATWDELVCDLRRLWEPGQAYVALSRLRTGQGLKGGCFDPSRSSGGGVSSGIGKVSLMKDDTFDLQNQLKVSLEESSRLRAENNRLKSLLNLQGEKEVPIYFPSSLFQYFDE